MSWLKEIDNPEKENVKFYLNPETNKTFDDLINILSDKFQKIKVRPDLKSQVVFNKDTGEMLEAVVVEVVREKAPAVKKILLTYTESGAAESAATAAGPSDSYKDPNKQPDYNRERINLHDNAELAVAFNEIFDTTYHKKVKKVYDAFDDDLKNTIVSELFIFDPVGRLMLGQYVFEEIKKQEIFNLTNYHAAYDEVIDEALKGTLFAEKIPMLFDCLCAAEVTGTSRKLQDVLGPLFDILSGKDMCEEHENSFDVPAFTNDGEWTEGKAAAVETVWRITAEEKAEEIFEGFKALLDKIYVLTPEEIENRAFSSVVKYRDTAFGCEILSTSMSYTTNMKKMFDIFGKMRYNIEKVTL